MKRTAAVVLAIMASLLNAPAAQADAPAQTCRFFASSQDGLNFEGVAAGTITHAGGGTVTIQCYITVDGNPVVTSYTPWTSGDTTAATAGQITFQAIVSQDVDICTLASTEHGPIDECFDTTLTADPSPAFTPLICDVTEFIGERGFDILGIIRIDEDGSVYVLDSLVIDCSSGDIPGQPAAIRYG